MDKDDDDLEIIEIRAEVERLNERIDLMADEIHRRLRALEAKVAGGEAELTRQENERLGLSEPGA
jgi:hypothetical protein